MRKRMQRSSAMHGSHFKALQLAGLAVLVLGFAMLVVGRTYVHAGSATVRHTLPVFGESTWGKWHKEDVGARYPTMSRPLAIGATLNVPNDTSIRVDSIDRNWAPVGPWQTEPTQPGGQDDARGKEIILVRFTITNMSSEPLNYTDAYFSLIRANGHEQRVAALAELTGDQYGSFGQATPWLMPGVTKHTFVPFLVNPGEQPRAFVYYRFRQQWPQTGAPQGKSIHTPPTLVGIARVVVSLTQQKTSGQSSQPLTMSPDASYTVSTSDVYSPSPQ